MIYSIKNKKSSKFSYLMGTMHIADKAVFINFENAKNLMNSCSHYLGEMNLGQVNPASVVEAFTLPQEYRYSILLKRHYEKYRQILISSFGLDISYFDNVAPLMLQSQLTSSIIGNQDRLSLDYELYNFALSKNMIVDGLESPSYQYEIARRLDLDEQFRQFKKICRKPELFRANFNHLLDLYQKGDDVQLYNSGRKSLGSFRKIMLNERNPKMAEKIVECIAHNTCFISVGAAHLQGNIGILAYLKKNGLEVKRVF